jgi:Zn-dependent peptidase ImmA (M78 family)/DNA-binding XRE family transcriptional regulator
MDIGKRIRKERKKLSIKLQDLAKEVGFANYQTLSSIEKGGREIKVSEIDSIAKALGVNVSYLMGDEEAIEERVLWRRCADKRKCDKFENELKGFCNNFKNLSELIGHKYERFVPPSPAELQKGNYHNDYEFSKALAEKYLNAYALGKYPGNNLIDILQDKNILIFCMDLEDFGSADSLVSGFGAAVLLNKNDTPWRRTFDIAHEFFHLITWNIYSPADGCEENGVKSNLDRYADAFASALLLPEGVLLSEVEKRKKENGLDLVDIIELAAKFKVSIQALTWRFENLMAFSEIWKNVKKEVFKGLNLDEIRNHPKIHELNKLKRVKEPDLPELPEIYVTQALKTYKAGRISKLKLAEYLSVTYGKMAHFLSKYSYPDVEEISFERIPT